MSELIFVRHGQATFGEDSYDKLSTTGHEQVKHLSSHWLALGEQFDCIYSGSLRRQIETADRLMSHIKDAPEGSLIHPGFNEYPGDPLIRVYLRDHGVGDGHPDSLRLPIVEERLFQKVFESAAGRWIKDELLPNGEDSDFETYRQFQQRVHGAIDELMTRHQRGSRVVVATSGGVIALALQRVLGFSDEQVIATNWMVYNSSVTRIRYGNGKISLTGFNGLAHLEKPELRHMITFR
ncbi:MAG: histidine phosphatase family protein [Pseudohongiellaceae bacterium]